MIKPSQKLIDSCISIIRDDSLNKKDFGILRKQLAERGFFDSVDLSDKELCDTITALVGAQRIDNMDLSDIDIPYQEYMLENIPHKQTVIKDWTDNVKWPIDIPFDPQKILQDAKHPHEIDAVHKQATGKNIGIAIIDQPLNVKHQEYRDRIKHYEVIGFWPDEKSKSTSYHGSLVTGCACGKTTGTAPNADIYYFAANNWPVNQNNPYAKATEKLLQTPLDKQHRYNYIIAIKRLLEINDSLPEDKKIRFLSCSWGTETDLLRQECEELFDECQKNGIMVIGGYYNLQKNKTTPFDKRYPNPTKNIGIPTNGKTTPYFKGGYIYKYDGGASSTYPYIAGIFACACQDNQIFFTRPNWQDELWDILRDTATESEHGGKMINPYGIRKRVTEIAHEMERDLIKQKATQHE